MRAFAQKRVAAACVFSIHTPLPAHRLPRDVSTTRRASGSARTRAITVDLALPRADFEMLKEGQKAVIGSVDGTEGEVTAHANPHGVQEGRQYT